MLELTVISAQGLKNPSSFSLFSNHLKPFITINPFPSPSSSHSIKGCDNNIYSTSVDNEGGPNPKWDDKFLLPLDPTFFTNNNYSCVYLQLYTKRRFLGPSLMGWIQIPGYDILNGHFPLGSVHYLSYRLREKDGSRGQGVVNVACKFIGQVPVVRSQPWSSDESRLTAVDTWGTVTGIPITTAWPNDNKV